MKTEIGIFGKNKQRYKGLSSFIIFFPVGRVRREDYTARVALLSYAMHLFYFCSEEISECEMGTVVAWWAPCRAE